jgi:hypothetical protein
MKCLIIASKSEIQRKWRLISMTDDEKQIMCALIMEDICGNWAWNLGRRVAKLMELATELNNEELVESIHNFDWEDGRHFRTNWPYGYLDLPFEVNGSLKSYSDEFQKMALDYLTFPDYLFTDYKKENEDERN